MSARTLKKALELAEQRHSVARSSNMPGPAAKKSKKPKRKNKQKQQMEKKIKALEEALHRQKDNYDQNIRFLTKSLQNVETDDLERVRKRLAKKRAQPQQSSGNAAPYPGDNSDFGFDDNDF